MGWWDDVKFVVAGEQSNAVKAAGNTFGQTPTGAALGVAPDAAGSVGGPVNAVSSGSGSAGTVSMSREEMEDTLKRANQLLLDITSQTNVAGFLTNMQAPAQDPGSAAATASANNGGNYYVGHLQRQAGYLRLGSLPTTFHLVETRRLQGTPMPRF